MKRQRVYRQMPAAVLGTGNDLSMLDSASIAALPPTTTTALTALAEELVRLVARHELVVLRTRRLGYGFPEVLLGCSIVAAASLLLYRLFG